MGYMDSFREYIEKARPDHGPYDLADLAILELDERLKAVEAKLAHAGIPEESFTGGDPGTIADPSSTPPARVS